VVLEVEVQPQLAMVLEVQQHNLLNRVIQVHMDLEMQVVQEVQLGLHIMLQEVEGELEQEEVRGRATNQDQVA
jgi:hypothetical protein